MIVLKLIKTLDNEVNKYPESEKDFQDAVFNFIEALVFMDTDKDKTARHIRLANIHLKKIQDKLTVTHD